ncbi:hypothetical protein TWF281_010538 [Arthrobotrys megalospora]
MEDDKGPNDRSGNLSSESSYSDIPDGVASESTVVLHVCKKLSSLRDKIILDAAGSPVYFAECHRSSANIQLHTGGDKKNPVVAELSPGHTHKYELNFGQQKHSMEQSSRHRSDLSWTVPGHPSSFQWVSAHRGNSQLVEEDSGKVVAAFVANRRVPGERGMGKFVIDGEYCEKYGLEFERGVVLGGLVLLGLHSRAVAGAGSAAASAIVI